MPATSITVTAIAARDGSHRVYAASVHIGSTKLNVPSNEGDPAPRKATASAPTPRWPDGHVQLGMTPGQTGYWASPSAHSLVETTAGNIRMNNDGSPRR